MNFSLYSFRWLNTLVVLFFLGLIRVADASGCSGGKCVRFVGGCTYELSKIERKENENFIENMAKLVFEDLSSSGLLEKVLNKSGHAGPPPPHFAHLESMLRPKRIYSKIAFSIEFGESQGKAVIYFVPRIADQYETDQVTIRLNRQASTEEGQQILADSLWSLIPSEDRIKASSIVLAQVREKIIMGALSTQEQEDIALKFFKRNGEYVKYTTRIGHNRAALIISTLDDL